MAADEPVTRREVDMLKVASDVEHARIWAKIESLDDHGSRGMGTLITRMDGMIRDVADLKIEVKTDVGELKSEMTSKFEIHQKEHETQQKTYDQQIQTRRDSRRWRLTATAGAIGTAVTVIALLLAILQTMH